MPPDLSASLRPVRPFWPRLRSRPKRTTAVPAMANKFPFFFFVLAVAVCVCSPSASPSLPSPPPTCSCPWAMNGERRGIRQMEKDGDRTPRPTRSCDIPFFLPFLDLYVIPKRDGTEAAPDGKVKKRAGRGPPGKRAGPPAPPVPSIG